MSSRNSFSISMAVIVFFFFLSSFPHNSLSFETCLPTFYDAPDSLPPITVQFPFVNGTADELHRCGYPGFNLTSSVQSPIISLPSSGSFTVLKIDHSAQTISLADPNHCLPNRLLTLNLANSPFYPTDLLNYTFLNCSKPNPNPRVANAVAVPCLSGHNFTVYMTSSNSAAEKLEANSSQCRPIKSVVAPIMRSRSEILTRFDSGTGTAFFQLSWSVPDCRRCRHYYPGVCGFKSNSGLEVGCSGHTAKVLVIVLLVKIFVSLVVFGCLAVVTGCCIRRCCAGRGISGNNNVFYSRAR